MPDGCGRATATATGYEQNIRFAINLGGLK
jgi:hypothetical protein